MSISVATFRVNLRWRRAKYSVFTTAKLSVFTLAYRSSPSWQMTSSDHCWGLEKKVHLGEILVSIRSMSEHCKQVVIPLLLYYPAYLTSESLFFCKMCFQQEQQFRALMALSAPAAPVFNLGEKSEIRDFVCKYATGTEKLTCKLGTLFGTQTVWEKF